MIKPQRFLLKSEQDYEEATARYEAIKRAAKGSDDHKEKLLLVGLISEYEKSQWDLAEFVSLSTRYKQLLNEILPASFTKPVRHNHCFNRIVLDWLFQDVWYNHLDLSKTAISQLNPVQLQQLIARMEQWLQQPDLLFEDNRQSLTWRKKSAP